MNQIALSPLTVGVHPTVASYRLHHEPISAIAVSTPTAAASATTTEPITSAVAVPQSLPAPHTAEITAASGSVVVCRIAFAVSCAFTTAAAAAATAATTVVLASA